MVYAKSLILIGLIISFFLGQLYRINILDFSFPLIDVFILILAVFNIFIHFIKNKRFVASNKYLLFFLIFAWLSLLINFIYFNFPPLKPLFYLIRLSCLLSFFIFPLPNNFINKKIMYLFMISIFANIIFGIIQYFIWPDFTYFNSLNWDPHLYRLVSTFFDPTFTGLIYLMFLIKIYFTHDINPQIRFPLLFFTYLALALTYSRSTFLALVIAAFFVSLKTKKSKIFLLTTLLVVSTIILLPRPPGEGTKLERTSSITAKIVNYQEGWSVFTQSPIIGHGYNNLMYIRQSNNPLSHGIAAFDGSLMTILTTTGLIGLLLFIFGLAHLFHSTSFLKQTILIAVLVHSLFANSLLYPWTLIFLLFI